MYSKGSLVLHHTSESLRLRNVFAMLIQVLVDHGCYVALAQEGGAGEEVGGTQAIGTQGLEARRI